MTHTIAVRLAPIALLATLAAAPAPPRLRIDPRLLVELQTVRSVIAVPDNPIWPGWNASDTPALIYLPGVQDVLIDHPRPPEGFTRVAVPPGTPAEWSVVAHDGKTLIEWDGQNTSREVNGVETLIVSDSPSTLRQMVRGLLEDPRPLETKMTGLDLEHDLVPDIDGELATMAHEAFHVFQRHSAPGKQPDERDVRVYPCLSVENNVGFALEGRALVACMRATDDRSARAAAVRWLAIREQRRRAIPRRAVAYEDGNEFSEGLAMYVELGLMKALEGRTPDPRFYSYQGFLGFEGLTRYRERRIKGLLGNLSGTVNVNNDPYGTSPARYRLYFSGMAIGSLLDRVSPGWKKRMFDEGVTLTGLAREALRPTPAELRRAWEQARSDTGYGALVRSKTDLARRGRHDTDSLYSSIWSGHAPTVVIDYADLATEKIGLSFTPYGVRELDSTRTIYTLIPISANVGSSANGFEQSIPLPTFEDRAAQRFAFPLERPLKPAELAALKKVAGAGEDSLRFVLPGATVYARRATTRIDGRTIHVRFLPDSSLRRPARTP